MAGLVNGDLKNNVKHIFEIDSYKSKMGEDFDIVVLSFTASFREPAEDLSNFIESGYNFVLDADVSPGETDDGTYKVFIEMQRNRHAVENIIKILEGLNNLTNVQQWRFRYYKSFKSFEATKENLERLIPLDKSSYNDYISQFKLTNFQNFFAKSYLESVNMNEDVISFKKKYTNPIRFKYITEGNSVDVYNQLNHAIDIKIEDMSKILFYTKYIGNFNINKSGNLFVFENKNYSVVLQEL